MHIANLIKNSLKNKIFWYLGSRYFTFLIQFVTSLYIALKLGAYYFGIWSFFILLVTIGQNINLGIGNAVNIFLVQNKDNTTKCNNYVFNAFILTSLITLVPLGVLACDTVFGIPYFEKYHLGNLIFAVVTSVILIYYNNLFINIFRVKNRILEIAINQSLTPALIFVIMFCSNDRKLLILLASSYVLAGIISLFLFLRARIVNWQGKFDKACSAELLQKGLYLFFYNACFYFIMLSTKTIISYCYSVEEFGYFSFAFNLANAAMLLIDSFMFLVFPKMIDLLKDPDKKLVMERINFMRSHYTVAVNGILYLAILTFSILIEFIPQYKASFSIFILVALTLLVYTNCFGYNTYMLAHNKEKIIALFALGTLAVNISSLLIIILLFKAPLEYCILGTMGAYLIYVASINIYSLNSLNDRPQISWWFSKIPLPIVIPFIAALLLTFTANQYLLWLPLALLILLNYKKLISTFKLFIAMIEKPQIIDL